MPKPSPSSAEEGGMIGAVANWLACLATAAGMLMTALIVLSAIMRYFVGAPFNFSEELVGLLSCSMAFLALPIGLVAREHIAITLVSERLPRTARLVADVVAKFILVAFLLVFTIEGFQTAAFSWRYGARSEIGNLPLFPWMGLLPLVTGFMLVVLATRALKAMRGHR